MAPIQIAAVLTCKSNLPADNVVNTWHFLTASPTYVSAEAIAAGTAVSNFYNVQAPAASNPIADYIGRQIKRGLDVHEFLIYDLTGHLDGSPHGSPVERVTWSMIPEDASNPEPLPSEIAACVTFHSDYASNPEFGPDDPITGNPTRPRSRDRGRVYLGPLNLLSRSTDPTTGVVRLSTQFASDLQKAALTLVDDTTCQWAQWSRKNASMEPVVEGWIDNAFDVQRRRGEEATVRTAF